MGAGPGSAAESETEEQGSSALELAIERRSTMNGVGEEEAPTATMGTVPLELVLKNPFVGEGGSGSASAKIRNACNLRLAPSYSLWIFNCDLQPNFLLYPYLSLAVLRLHDTMTTVNLDCVELYQPPNRAERTDKNPVVTLQHEGVTAADTRDGDAGMWNPA